MSVLNLVFNEDKKILRVTEGVVDVICSLADKYRKMSDSELKKQTVVLKERLANNETLDDVLPDAFAVAREASWRIEKIYPYPCQLLGGIILHRGDVAEMRTGEGKTITAVLPSYLNALTEKGVHVVTVNEYLAERDSQSNGKVLEYLGLSTGFCSSSMSKEGKRKAYSCDVTYTTNSELGFDYLRDNMVTTWKEKVQRGFNFCIIDEADSILIDEARTPLIISGGSKSTEDFYARTDTFSKGLIDEDVEIDLEKKTIHLTTKGQDKAERFFKTDNLYYLKNSALVHHLQNALRANKLFTLGVEYIVKDEKIALVDQFTGRVMANRSYSDGLHQAIQAKEGVEIEKETKTLATVTYQNFFRIYNKISGMTGTAKTEEEEFRKIYNMRVIQIPTNRAVIRFDENDEIYGTKKAKFKAILKEILLRNKDNQPVLVGTASVEDSELVSQMLTLIKVPHNVLNAKNHGREAEIITNAGKRGSITISTNMAGRGTDIKLGPGIRETGGLAVLGTERHESRRIDNQLRGRSGRQGDPGFSKFFISVEDNLMQRFGGDRIKEIFTQIGEETLEGFALSKSISGAQKELKEWILILEKMFFYDNILSQQREIIYGQRDQILVATNLMKIIKNMTFEVVRDVVCETITEKGVVIDYSAFLKPGKWKTNAWKYLSTIGSRKNE